jgi:hypothetical protein
MLRRLYPMLRVSFVISVVLLLAGCGGAQPSISPSADLTATTSPASTLDPATATAAAAIWQALATVPSGTTTPSTSQGKPTMWVGQVTGTDAFIGISRLGQDWLVYVCDGRDGKLTISEWFKGSQPGDSIDLKSKAGAQLAGQLSGDTVAGTFRLSSGGQAYVYSASLASGDAGLIRLEQTIDGQPWIGGWIQLTDHQLRGILPPSSGSNCYCDAYHQRWCYWYGYWLTGGSCQ